MATTVKKLKIGTSDIQVESAVRDGVGQQIIDHYPLFFMQSTAPVVTNNRYAIWIDTSNSYFVLKVWNLTEWVNISSVYAG